MKTSSLILLALLSLFIFTSLVGIGQFLDYKELTIINGYETKHFYSVRCTCGSKHAGYFITTGGEQTIAARPVFGVDQLTVYAEMITFGPYDKRVKVEEKNVWMVNNQHRFNFDDVVCTFEGPESDWTFGVKVVEIH